MSKEFRRCMNQQNASWQLLSKSRWVRRCPGNDTSRGTRSVFQGPLRVADRFPETCQQEIGWIQAAFESLELSRLKAQSGRFAQRSEPAGSK